MESFKSFSLGGIQGAFKNAPAAMGLIEDQLADLAEDVAPDECAPTAEAKAALLDDMGHLLHEFILCGAEPLLPHVSSLGGGDLTCTWMRPVRTLFLSISPVGKRRLQRIVMRGEKAETIELIDSPDESALFHSVLWVMGDDGAK